MKIKLKSLCKKNKITLYKLAKELKLPRQTIYSWNNMRTQPSYYHMDLLCTYFHCTMNELFESEGTEK